jgi:type 1 glutamine amidotransferase
MKRFIVCLFLLILPALCHAQKEPDLSVLAVRGGHYYQTPGFEDMCLALTGIKCDLVLTSHFEAMTVQDIDEKYDAVLFLNQNKKYQTQAKHKQQYIELTKRGVGLVFLHFTLSSQPDWDEYHDLVGGKYFLRNRGYKPERESRYYPSLKVNVKVVSNQHPVTQGLQDFMLDDAFYDNIYIAPTVVPLLVTHTPKVSKTIAWAHVYHRAKIVYIMPGFSNGAYTNPSYKKLIENAVSYVAE